VEGGGVRNGKMVENLGMEGMFGNGGQSGLGSGGNENEGNGGKPGKCVKACLVVLVCKRFLAARLKLMLEKLKAKKKIMMKDFFEAMVKNEEECCKICKWEIWFEIVCETKGECLVNIYRVRVKLI